MSDTSEPGSPPDASPPAPTPLDVTVSVADESGAPIAEGGALSWHGGERLANAPGLVVRRTAASTWVRGRHSLWAAVAAAPGSARAAVTLRRAGPEIVV